MHSPDVDVMTPVGADALGEPLPVPVGRFVRAGVLGRDGYIHVDADHLQGCRQQIRIGVWTGC
jgi:hypothetical protein